MISKCLFVLDQHRSVFNITLASSALRARCSPFKRTSRQVHKAFWSHVRPVSTPKPVLVSVSPAALADLGLPNKEQLLANQPDLAEYVVGNKLLDGTNPWAQAYAGHQFGVFAGQLGDGRAISLFQTSSGDQTWELQLKGAGRTPFSRFADGLAVIRSSIREYVCSEYLARLGIPTTRAVAMAVTPNRGVMREQGMEMGAVVMRMAESWARIGTLELAMMREWKEGTEKLVAYLVEHHFKDIWAKHAGQPTEDMYLDFFGAVVERNAHMVAHWQALGFVHGVLNTDNTSLLGLTLDFGPYGFLDDYDPSWTPNTTDEDGRYCFANQPGIILWNLARMARCMIDLMVKGDGGKEEMDRIGAKLKTVLDKFIGIFLENWISLMRGKLGLTTTKEDDDDTLVHPLLEILQNTHTDYTIFFRTLSSYSLSMPSTGHKAVSDLILESLAAKSFKNAFRRRDPDAKPITAENVTKDLDTWFQTYHDRLLSELGTAELSSETLQAADNARKLRMWKANPKWVPRQWIMQDIIETCSKSPICTLPANASLSSAEMSDPDANVPETPADPDNNIGIVDSAMRVLLGDVYGEVSDAEEWEKLGEKPEKSVWAEGWGLKEWMLVEKWSGEPPVGFAQRFDVVRVLCVELTLVFSWKQKQGRNFQCSCSS